MDFWSSSAFMRNLHAYFRLIRKAFRGPSTPVGIGSF